MEVAAQMFETIWINRLGSLDVVSVDPEFLILSAKKRYGILGWSYILAWLVVATGLALLSVSMSLFAQLVKVWWMMLGFYKAQQRTLQSQLYLSSSRSSERPIWVIYCMEVRPLIVSKWLVGASCHSRRFQKLRKCGFAPVPWRARYEKKILKHCSLKASSITQQGRPSPKSACLLL